MIREVDQVMEGLTWTTSSKEWCSGRRLERDESATLPETNIAPENRPSQKETSIPTIHF